jgi:hypothetical protein
MKRFAARFVVLFAILGLAAVAVAAIVSPDVSSPAPANPAPLDPPVGITPAASTLCCDPTLEPGTGGNPPCFEGHTCCSDGFWRCNNADGTPGCTVCGTACGARNTPCSTGADCCSGVCKPNGRCK